MSVMGIMGQDLKTILSYLKSAPSNLSNWKLAEKTKFPKFGTKNALFGFIWGRILKNYCHISDQHPQICQIPKFCETVERPNFGTKNVLFGYFWARI